MVALGYSEVEWDWVGQVSVVFIINSVVLLDFKNVYTYIKSLLVTNFHISMKAMIIPKNVPGKFDLWMQNKSHSHDISSSQEEQHNFENKVIT